MRTWPLAWLRSKRSWRAASRIPAMALNPTLLEVLACPRDKQPLYYFDDEGWLYNPRLRIRYAIDDDIPILLPASGEELDDEAHAEMMATIAARSLPPTGPASTQ